MEPSALRPWERGRCSDHNAVAGVHPLQGVKVQHETKGQFKPSTNHRILEKPLTLTRQQNGRVGDLIAWLVQGEEPLDEAVVGLEFRTGQRPDTLQRPTLGVLPPTLIEAKEAF